MVLGFYHISSHPSGLKDMCFFACKSSLIAEFNAELMFIISQGGCYILGHRCRAACMSHRLLSRNALYCSASTGGIDLSG